MNIIILGTNREESNTLREVRKHYDLNDYEIVDLRKLKIAHWQYGEDKPIDDFYLVVDKMLQADHIVFATPVYWYAMSGYMKIFFDRLSDLITAQKKKGRALAGKTTELFCNGSDEQLPEGFEVPFKRTSEYFDMEFNKVTYVSTKDI